MAERRAFPPWADRGAAAEQPPRAIPGYPRSIDRTPGRAPVPRAVSRADLAGPILLLEPAIVASLDLARVRPTAPRAMGQLIRIAGQVRDEAGRPVRHAVIEVWQANAAGKYIHHNDPSPVPVDPNFRGTGRLRTDVDGRFEVHTIKPGAYAVPYEEQGGAIGWWRPPHVHLSVFGEGFASRLVTQVYFPGEPLNELDLLLRSIADPAAQARLVARFDPALATGEGALGYRHDIVLAGPLETPFEGA